MDGLMDGLVMGGKTDKRKKRINRWMEYGMGGEVDKRCMYGWVDRRRRDGGVNY